MGAVTLDKGKVRAEARAELGYVVARACWGKGIATRAAELAVETGFDDLGVHRIEAFVDPDNVGSLRVLEKAGFGREAYFKSYLYHRGHLRDRVVYGAYRG